MTPVAISSLLPPAQDPLTSDLSQDSLYEVVDGLRVELSPMSAYAHLIALRLFFELSKYLEQNPVGIALHETLLVLDKEKRLQRRPDVAVLGVDRWDLTREFPEAGELPVVPTIAVEVLSPNDLVRDVLHKTHEYLKYGVEEVWLIVPDEQVLYRYRSSRDLQVLENKDVLLSETLLPGFSLPISDLLRRTVAAV